MASINGKLTRLVGLSVGGACIVMGGLNCWQELDRFSAAKQQELLSVSSAFGAAAASAVAHQDRTGALQALRGIADFPVYTYASVRGLDNILISEVGAGARLATDVTLADQSGAVSPISLFLTGTVQIDRAILDDGRTVGWLRLVSDATEIRSRLLTVMLESVGTAALALLVSLAVSFRLQRAITDPLVRLTAAMVQIRRTHDYNASVEVTSDDEVGLLAQTFQTMLHEVRERDGRLVRHQHRLEADVADRTRELVVAKTEADQANAAKSDFLATMSHEIRTPMNGLMVMADLLSRTELSPRPRRYAQVIAQSGQGLLAIINDILDFSKIEAGKLTVETIQFDPVAVIDRTLALHSLRAEERGLDLARYVAPDVPPMVEGDPARFGQIISNLLGNAIKFTSSGSVTLRSETREGSFVVSITDTGIGIPQDKLDSIFTAFSQAEQSTTRRFGGTGLGLSICRRLAAAMGASVEVSSALGQGSTFRLMLPIQVADVEITIAPDPQTVVLQIDGDATRATLAEYLAAYGHRIVQQSEQARHAIVDHARIAGAGARPPVPGRVITLVSSTTLPDQIRGPQSDLVVNKPVIKADWADILALLDGAPIVDRSIREAPTATLQQYKGLRVLVVDDSDLNLEIASEALRQFGIEAETCLDGAEAISRVFAKRFDLVLMDGSMPGLDGYDATRHIREREMVDGVDRTRIIALTAHVVGAAAEAWSSSGMDGVLHKPFTMAALAAVLGEIAPAATITPAEAAITPAEAVNAEQDSGRLDLLDASTLDNLRYMAERSGSAFLVRIVDLFVSSGPKAIEAIRAAAERHDPDAAASAAHQLKSMSLNVGATQLASRLQSIETGARDQGTFPSGQVLHDLETLFEATADELRAALGEAAAELEVARCG